MKHFYSILCGLLLCGLLAVGLWLMPHLPAFAAEGNYAEVCQESLAAQFPQWLNDVNTSLNGFYTFSGLAEKEDVQLVIDIHNDAADKGLAMTTEPTSTEPEPSTMEPSTEESVVPTTTVEPTTTEPITTEEPTQEPEVDSMGQLMLVGNRAVELPEVDYDAIHRYAETVTKIATALEGVQTYSVLVPNASEFYIPASHRQEENSQKNMIDYAYANMGNSVKKADAYAVLAEHSKEEIYFRTDHHWTQLGAYYAYTAFCEAAGLTPAPLSEYERKSMGEFVGSMYGFLSGYPQREILREEPDEFFYYVSKQSIKTRYYDDGRLSWAGKIDLFNEVSSIYNKYLCFLGGDHPVTVIETDVEGPVCLLVKESYGNAFAPWLTAHYSKIICIDPREFNRDGMPSLNLAAFAQQQGVDDCIILNYPVMLNNNAYVAWLGRLVK